MPAPLLTDVLRALSVPAADALVAELRNGYGTLRGGELQDARGACRALRDLVDASRTSLRLNVRAGDVARWRAGWLPPSLARWPHANDIALDFYDAADADALLLAAPILEGARQRLTQLVLHDDHGGLRGSEVAVAALAPRLPALRSLTLTGLFMPEAMSYDPEQQAAMHGALAELPCLEHLVLPGCRSLDCAGPLAGSSSLRSLTVEDCGLLRYGGSNLGRDPVTLQALENISSLQRLQRLSLHCSLHWRSSAGAADSGGLLALLASLPPSVEQLEVQALINGDYQAREPVQYEGMTVAIRLRQGRIQSLRLVGEDLSLENVSLLAGALLSCPKLGSSLELLELAMPLSVLHEEEVQLMEPLLELFGRCQRAKLPALHLCATGLSVEAALDVLLWLPRAEAVRLWAGPGGGDLHVRFGGPHSPPSASAPAAAGAPTAGAATATGGQHSRQDRSCNRSPGSTPTELLRAAVQRWAESSRANTDGTYVLLRGPTVAGLVGSPQDLAAWVRQLAQRAGVAVGGPGGGARVESLKAVPPAAAVVLRCNSNGIASAVAAAARAAELEASAAALPAGAVSAAGAVEAVVAESCGADTAAVVVSDIGWACGTALGRWASEVAQEVLEGGHGAGAWGERERVRCVLQLWAELKGLPVEIRL